MKETIKAILYSWMERELPEVIRRELEIDEYLSMRPNKIIAITGFRRVGKTYLLFDTIKKLLRSLGKEDVIYINFDDERIPRRIEFLTELIPTIIEEFGKLPKYLFLDEIQNMPNWSMWLRRVYEEENMRIVITGSSSKVSSREIPTELRGRGIEVPLFPLSFTEFLIFKNENFDPRMLKYETRERARIISMLQEYMEYGGMPEVVLSERAIRLDILQDYYRTMLMRDVVERYRVKNEEALRALVRLLLNSKSYSVSKLYNTLKSMNYQVGKSTILNYIGYLETAYFIHSVPIFSYKIKDQLQYPRKVYFVDNGFITALSMKFSKDIGRKMENLVAMELRRRDKEIFYWRGRNGKEVDFVVVENGNVQELIQVSYDVSDPDTMKREIRALKEASKELGCKNLKIITWDYEEEGEIEFIPLWKWLFKKYPMKVAILYLDNQKV